MSETVKVKDVLGIGHKTNSLTIEELAAAIQAGLSHPVIQSSEPVKTSMTILGVALQLYSTVLTLVNAVQAATPPIKTATKIAGTALNPSLGTEAAQDTLIGVQGLALDGAKSGIKEICDRLMNFDIELGG